MPGERGRDAESSGQAAATRDTMVLLPPPNNILK
ncbi:hypothetical protein KMAL_31740 [Novacetimonas maltaceti]|uniref:Uncharacterized protein n=1 Tax=Novacetimonas maltaceti TaxID=1203393 RepID=A0A2S3VX59_9PROT|nr:hypothetical protein KMAL_31740 [Novacetimonas maltaceti]